VRLLAHLSRWLSANHLEVIDLTNRRDRRVLRGSSCSELHLGCLT